jgi:predicted GNAT family N-acyltransferase
MATEFVAFLPPPSVALANYSRTSPPDQQPPNVPQTFKEAMEVREEVFVKQQGVPLENELDEDDPRSFHWVAYASVGTAGTSSPASMAPTDNAGANVVDASSKEERRKSESTATRVPVGTIRLVPPPHAPHPVLGGSEHRRASVEIKDNGSENPSTTTTVRSDSQHSPTTPNEPYIKLGRLAVVPAYRGLRLSRLLINAALNWAKSHPEDILPPLAPADVEAARQEGRNEVLPWRGLMLVHAQTQVQRLWESFGFVKDYSMGMWIEEGIEHVGLWRRVDVKGDGPRAPLS